MLKFLNLISRFQTDNGGWFNGGGTTKHNHYVFPNGGNSILDSRVLCVCVPTEYGFDYKPWTVERSSSLPYAGLYFPRFDFKFYDGAASKLDAQKWFYPLVLRLLQHQPPVLDLFDDRNVPSKAPRFIRASLYRFAYTTLPTKGTSGAFWERERLGDYFSVFSMDASHLQEKLKQIGYWKAGATESARDNYSWNWLLLWLLDAVRRFVSSIEGSYLLTGLLVAALTLIYSQCHQSHNEK